MLLWEFIQILPSSDISDYDVSVIVLCVTFIILNRFNSYLNSFEKSYEQAAIMKSLHL